MGLKIEREFNDKFTVRLEGYRLKVTAYGTEEVAQAVMHYFEGKNPKHAEKICPLCRDIASRTASGRKRR